jgi:hypothetical protein
MEQYEDIYVLRNEFSEIDHNDESMSIIIFGETQEKAYQCAEALFGTRIEEGRDVWRKNFNGHDFYGYVRWTQIEKAIKPKSTVYGMYFNYDNELFYPTKDYNTTLYNIRGEVPGIPKECTYLKTTLGEDLDFYYSFNFTYDFSSSEFSTDIFQNCVNYHDQVRNLFDNIDVNKNGTIDAKELMQLLNLNQNSDREKAEEYLKSISDKEVNFNRFRSWYVHRGHYDDLIGALGDKLERLKVGEKFSKVFKACEDEINQMSHEERAKDFESNFNISASETFTPGMKLEVLIEAGDTVKEIDCVLPEDIKKEKLLFAIIIPTKSQEVNGILRESLNNIKSMVFAMIPELQTRLDIVIGDPVDEEMCDVPIYMIPKNNKSIEDLTSFLSTYDLTNLHFNSKFKFKFGTGLSPLDLLVSDYETIIKNAAKINISNSSTFKFSLVSKFMMKYLSEIRKDEGETGSLQLKMFTLLVCFMRIMPYFETNYRIT